ncbi:unnamed protein product, partial [Orchesella dallaii]
MSVEDIDLFEEYLNEINEENAGIDEVVNEDNLGINEQVIEDQEVEAVQNIEANEQIRIQLVENSIENSDQQPSTSNNIRVLRNREVDFTKTVPKRSRKKKEVQQVMAGNEQNANPPGDAAVVEDDAFRDLAEDQVNRIKNLISQQVLQALGSLKVTSVNPNIEIPEYDCRKMTSETYFKKCEDYFNSQGYRPSQYHEMIGSIMKKESRLWYDSVSYNIKSWDNFKQLFKSRYDSRDAMEKRKRRLYTRQQKLDESVEQFVHEMVNLARQIDPTEEEGLSVSRAADALIPDLRLAIGELPVWSINNLLEKASRAASTIRAQDKIHKTTRKLPPIYGYRDGRESYQGRSSNFGRGQQQDRYQNNQRPQNFNDRRENNTGFRPRANSFTRDMSKVQCYRCGEWGHFSKDCQKVIPPALRMNGQQPPHNPERSRHNSQPNLPFNGENANQNQQGNNSQ